MTVVTLVGSPGSSRQRDEGSAEQRATWTWPWTGQRQRFWHPRPGVELIGFWVGTFTSTLPDPRAFVDPTWEEDERRLVLEHLDGAPVAISYLGWADCRICGRMNGTRELSDAVFLWPDGLPHYLREHDVRLPRRFVEHVRRSPLPTRLPTEDDVVEQLSLMFAFGGSRVRRDCRWWCGLRSLEHADRAEDTPGAPP